MKYFIFLVLTLMLLPFVATAQCGNCDEQKTEQVTPKNTTFTGNHLWFGFSGVTIFGSGREPLNLVAPSIGFSWPLQKWAGKVTVFGDVTGYYNNDDASGYYPWGFSTELIIPASKPRKSWNAEISFGATFAYDRTDKDLKRTVTPNVSFAVTQKIKKLGLLNLKFGVGPVGVTTVTFANNNANNREILLAWNLGLTLSPNL